MNVNDGVDKVMNYLKEHENEIQSGYKMADEDFIKIVGTTNNINIEVENELLHNLRYFYKKQDLNQLFITQTGLDFIADMP